METEIDRLLLTNGLHERNPIIQEYEAIVESLQQDLKECKVEQVRLRDELNALRVENKNASDQLREVFNQTNEKYGPDGAAENREYSENLQKQIGIIQLEKETVVQLWQMALKANDTLEQELKETHKDGKTIAYYEGQVNNVKETYSEAIKELEAKLLQVKDNFTKHQALWESAREKISELKCEKSDLERQLMNLKHELSMNDESNRRTIEILETNLRTTRQELEAVMNSKLKLESALHEARDCATKFAAKDRVSQEKVAEALEIVEVAMREKEQILQREQRVIDEKSKLEARLAGLAEEFALRLEKELIESKENLERNTKKYIFEIKELKSELREKVTLLDRAQRESQLYEEELEKVRHGSDDYLHKTSSKILEYEQKLKETESKLEIAEDSCRRKYEDKLRASESRIIELEEKLSSCNDRLRRNQLYGTREMDDRLRDADERVKEAVERYCNLEKRLSRTLEERETIASELRSLQLISEREIARKESERRQLEGRLRDLQEDLSKANSLADKSVMRCTGLVKHVETLEKETQELRNQSVLKGDNQLVNDEKSLYLRTMQDKYEERIAELTKYAKIHQKLSNRWKEEAELIATKFQSRYKELRTKANMLKKENEELNNELLSCRQEIALFRAQSNQRFDQGDGAR